MVLLKEFVVYAVFLLAVKPDNIDDHEELKQLNERVKLETVVPEAHVGLQTDEFIPIPTKLVLKPEAKWVMNNTDYFTAFHNAVRSEDKCKQKIRRGYLTEVCFKITTEGFQVNPSETVETLVCKKNMKCKFDDTTSVTIRSSKTPDLPPGFAWSDFYYNRNEFTLSPLDYETNMTLPEYNIKYIPGVYHKVFKSIHWSVRGLLMIEEESHYGLSVKSRWVVLNYIIDTPLFSSDGLFGIFRDPKYIK